ncbi:MAG: ATP-binding protein [Chloroflexota bacterium]
MLVAFRRLQIERGWHHLYVIPPTLIAPPPMNATPIYAMMMVIAPLLLLSTASTFWYNIDALNGIENMDMFFLSVCIFLAGSFVLSYSPETTTILSKLIGVGLFVITILIISLLLFLTPLIDDAYDAPHQMADQQHFRFVPLEGGRYQVHGLSDRQGVAMRTSLGSVLALNNEEALPVELDFDFPFYGQARRTLFVADNGFIAFDQAPSNNRFNSNRQPMIAPLKVDLNPELGGQIVTNASQDQITITWAHVPDSTTNAPNTFQVTLYANGTIDFVYDELNPSYDYTNFEKPLQLVGLLPGNTNPLPASIRFTPTLNHTSVPDTAIVENFSWDYRAYLHSQMWPIALILLGTMGIVMIGFPLFFQFILMRPLRTLLDGIKQVDAGQLDLALKPTFDDEIGQITNAFNRMVGSIQQSQQEIVHINLTLENRVHQRTEALVEAKEMADEAREAAEVANRAKSTFLANMSHELRTPLNSVLGYARLLQRTSPETQQLKIIEQSGQHLLTLISDVLDIAKIEAGKIELQPAVVQLPAFLNQIQQMITLQTQEKGLKFIAQVDADLPTYVSVDPKRLRQILLNLLHNAVKFTDAGEIRFTVMRLPTSSSDICQLRFEVQDTGVGIAPEHLSTIFQPFEQIGDQEGTGLGLTISQHLVTLMDGELAVTSKVGQGTHFHFEIALPIADVSTSEQTSDIMLPIGVKGTPPPVLLIDDIELNRALLVDLLQPLGFTLHEATDGDAGLVKAKELFEPPHQKGIILMDLVMPGLSGFDLLRQLRAETNLADVTVIVVSASVFHDDYIRTEALGADAFLDKPVDSAELYALLTHHAGVEWSYAEEHRHDDAQATITVSQEEDRSPTVTIPVSDRRPSITQLEEINAYVGVGDMRALKQFIATSTSSDEEITPFMHKLQTLVEQFQIEELERWITALIKEENKED